MLADRIRDRLQQQEAALRRQWESSGPIHHFVLDDVLPDEWAQSIRSAFPPGEKMSLKRSLRELKYIAAQMNNYDPRLEDAVYAFQSEEIVNTVTRITGLRALEPDHLLYAGGISMMAPNHFLNPHLDNSHDKFRERYRVLNLLYYVSPDWSEANGGNLELWPQGPRGKQQTIVSKFNRLAVMVTNQHSWHSVSRNLVDAQRCCVSNYYFSKYPAGANDYFQVTSFRGRPEQPLRDLVLRTDVWARTMVRKLFPKGVKDNRHYYKKDQ